MNMKIKSLAYFLGVLACAYVLLVMSGCKQKEPSFVFDEVDAGVGGASALEIGRRLDVLAQTSQVIVVTHLAQVAAFANNHLRVVKDTDGQVTTSSVQVLAGEERVTELARMLGGMADSQTALSHARELIEKTHSVSRR
jgi:DNA repair protein RecN (Recombination protein N)